MVIYLKVGKSQNQFNFPPIFLKSTTKNCPYLLCGQRGYHEDWREIKKILILSIFWVATVFSVAPRTFRFRCARTPMRTLILWCSHFATTPASLVHNNLQQNLKSLVLH